MVGTLRWFSNRAICVFAKRTTKIPMGESPRLAPQTAPHAAGKHYSIKIYPSTLHELCSFSVVGWGFKKNENGNF